MSADQEYEELIRLVSSVRLDNLVAVKTSEESETEFKPILGSDGEIISGPVRNREIHIKIVLRPEVSELIAEKAELISQIAQYKSGVTAMEKRLKRVNLELDALAREQDTDSDENQHSAWAKNG